MNQPQDIFDEDKERELARKVIEGFQAEDIVFVANINTSYLLNIAMKQVPLGTSILKETLAFIKGKEVKNEYDFAKLDNLDLRGKRMVLMLEELGVCAKKERLSITYKVLLNHEALINSLLNIQLGD